MVPTDKPYDDQGLTPAQVEEIDALITQRAANKDAPRPLAVSDEESRPVTEAEHGMYGDCVTTAKYWGEIGYTLFDDELMARFERGKKELERRGIDVLLMDAAGLNERSQKNGGRLAEAFHAGSEAKVKTMPSLKIMPRTTFSFAFR